MAPLQAKAANCVDKANYIGVSSDKSDRMAESPEYLEQYVDLRLVNKNRGEATGPLAMDLRGTAEAQMSWDIEVATDQPNASVRITWPGLSAAPKEYTFTLYDVDTKKSQFMRTSTFYEYNSGDAKAPRRLRVVADKNGGGVLLITGVTANRARGATTISYNMTRDAEVQVKITDLRGRVVRTLKSRAAATGGLNSVTWDEMDIRGRRIPQGFYVVEVQGRTEDGQSSRAVQPINIGK